MQDLDGNPLEPARSEDDQNRGSDLDLDGTTWVDDHAVFTTRDHNDAVHNIRAIMVTLEEVAARHVFSLNTKKGKTECVIAFAVKGIMEARRALDWQEDHAQLQYGDGGILRLVDSYKHLGTLHDKHLCRIAEVVRPAKAARTVIAAISTRVLRNTLLARVSNVCGAPHAAQRAIYFADHEGGSIAVPTTASSPCSALATFPPATPQRESVEADYGDGPL